MSHWAKACEAVYREVGDGSQLPSPNSALAWEFWAGFAIQVGPPWRNIVNLSNERVCMKVIFALFITPCNLSLRCAHTSFSRLSHSCVVL